MIYKIITIILISLTQAPLAQAQRKNNAASKPPMRKIDSIIDTVRFALPRTTHLQPINDVWTAVLDQKNNTTGYLLNSTTYGKENVGYGEDVPTLVILDKNRRVVRVAVVNSLETPAYLRIIQRKGLFEQWRGKHINELSTLKIDAISGATYTSEAIIKNVKLIGEQASKRQPTR